MKLVKLLNHNALVVEDNGFEKVVLGKGIGFGLSNGQEVDQTKIEHIFSSDAKNNLLIELIREIPDSCLELSKEIIMYAESVLHKELSDSIYITLTDHINFVVERCKQNILPSNPLKYDVQRFYTSEYQIGKKAVELLEDEYEIKLNNDEAASIALHIVNAVLDTDMYTSAEVIKLMDNIMQIIKYNLQIEFDENSMSYQRLITHLKFFVERIIKRVQYVEDNPLFNVVKENYPVAYECIIRLKEFIETTYDFQVSADECTYLIIHIQRLLIK